MDKKDLFSVGIKFFALLLFLDCLSNIFQFVLELTAPPSNPFLSLYSVSAYGTIIRITKIISYGLVGYFLFIKSDKIAGKFISESKVGETSRETVLQMVIAYIGITGIMYSTLTFLRLIFMPASTPFAYSTFLVGTYLFELIISILLLRYYEKITHFLLRKIPQKFWSK